MAPRTLIGIGAVGAAFAAICCFTAFLPVVLGAFGLTGLLGVLYNDMILIPALVLFLVILGMGIWQIKHQR